MSRFDPVDSLLREAVRERAFPGVSLLIGRGDDVVHRASSGVALEDSVFDVASLTKPVVAALFFILCEEGLLSLDGKLFDILPIEPSDPRARDITFRQLLSHTAGFKAWSPFYEMVRQAHEPVDSRPLAGSADAHDAMIAAAASLPLSNVPGIATSYSDLGFILLGRALEVAGFAPLDRLLSKRIIGPLGMTDAGFLAAERTEASYRDRIVPTGLSEVRGIEKDGLVDDENCAAMGGVSGHAGLFATAADLFLFSREIVRARRGEGRILSRSQSVAMTTKVPDPPGCTRTPGFDTPTPPSQAGSLFPKESVGHLGFTGCSLWLDLASETTVILLTNRVALGADSDGIKTWRPRIHEAVMTEMNG